MVGTDSREHLASVVAASQGVRRSPAGPRDLGTFAVQLAKSKGVPLTAVCSARNADRARSLGADVVIDYGREDFSQSGRQYDLVLDLVVNRSLRDLRRMLKPSGTIVLSGEGVSGQERFIGPLGLMIRGQLMARASRERSR
jgi:NADPH:quinone reductase-like Zn-dependent oxidoreductase